MVTCEECGTDLVDGRGCSYCEGTYCQDHRLPEHHDCAGVRSQAWDDWDDRNRQ
ncbi:MAG: AN1-type zinc finger domain-containing protein [Haloferacaceae archaeon]